MMRIGWAWCCAIALLVFSPGAPATDIRDTLPGPADLPGWQIVPNTLKVVSGSGLAQIYDGGFPMYLDFGVTRAATQLYRCGDSVLTITSHELSGPDEVIAFYTHWRSGSRDQPGFREEPDGAFSCDYVGTAAGYGMFGGYVLSCSTSDGSPQCREAVAAAISHAHKAIDKPGPSLIVSAKLPRRGLIAAGYRFAPNARAAARQYPELADWDWPQPDSPLSRLRVFSAAYSAPFNAEAYVSETDGADSARALFALARLVYRSDVVVSSAWRSGYLEKVLYSRDLRFYHALRTHGSDLIYVRGAASAAAARSLAEAVAGCDHASQD
jgi:hypothetical protein